MQYRHRVGPVLAQEVEGLGVAVLDQAYNKAHPDEPLPRLQLHGLRPTWATHALEEGIDIHGVSDRLDNGSTHITSQIYTHATRPMQSDAADRVAARIPCRGR